MEAGTIPLWEMPSPSPLRSTARSPGQILPLDPRRGAVQLGIRGSPNAMGELLADSDLQDLGMHTELCSTVIWPSTGPESSPTPQEPCTPAGVLLGLSTGSRELFGLVDGHREILGAPLSYVNSPWVIAQNERMISINGCLNVDLYGQICSESAGLRQISGTGGQLDFGQGHRLPRAAGPFPVQPSTYRDKADVRHSRILPIWAGTSSPRPGA